MGLEIYNLREQWKVEDNVDIDHQIQRERVMYMQTLFGRIKILWFKRTVCTSGQL
jgi:hypothetical protein